MSGEMKMKTIKVKSKDGEAFLDLIDFSDIVNTSKVEYYTLEEVDDNGQMALILKFYDKDQNVLDINSAIED